MLFSKCWVSVLFLYLVQGTLSKPTENNTIEGRGIGSTLWGWITYPFSWWSSDGKENEPINDHLIATTTSGLIDNNIEIGKHNVTIWCNDQTCTTMKCNQNGCKNNTCNIYDTDMNGECREYHISIYPEEPARPEKTSSELPLQTHTQVTKNPNKETETPSTKAPTPISVVDESNKATKDINHSTNSPDVINVPSVTVESHNVQGSEIPTRPLELEAALSLSIPESSTFADKNEEPAGHRKQLKV